MSSFLIIWTPYAAVSIYEITGIAVKSILSIFLPCQYIRSQVLHTALFGVGGVRLFWEKKLQKYVFKASLALNLIMGGSLRAQCNWYFLGWINHICSRIAEACAGASLSDSLSVLKTFGGKTKILRVQSRHRGVVLLVGLAHHAHQVLRLRQPHPLFWIQSTGIFYFIFYFS